MPHPLFEKHQTQLQQAVAAIESRGYWSPYAEGPRAYGETAIEDGRKAFEAHRGAQFDLALRLVRGPDEPPFNPVLTQSFGRDDRPVPMPPAREEAA